MPAKNGNVQPAFFERHRQADFSSAANRIREITFSAARFRLDEIDAKQLVRTHNVFDEEFVAFFEYMKGQQLPRKEHKRKRKYG
jgi:hypothetical protein